MHKSPAIMLIAAKKSAMGDEHPDYSGSCAGPRMHMAEEPDDMPGSPDDMAESDDTATAGPDMSADARTELIKIKKELHKASDMHAKQAERIETLLGSAEDAPGSADSPDPGGEDSHGEKRELS